MEDDQALLLYAYQAVLANVTGAMRAIYMKSDRATKDYHVQLTGVFRYAPTEREKELMQEMASEIRSSDENVKTATGACLVTQEPLPSLPDLGQQLYVRAEEFEGPEITKAPY
jgi:hypothetical protein